MYPVLILREEIVCIIILIFLAFTSKIYKMGKDSILFGRIITYAIIHVVFDFLTVLTVNNDLRVSLTINIAFHVVFYIAAILYAKNIFRVYIKPLLKE